MNLKRLLSYLQKWWNHEKKVLKDDWEVVVFLLVVAIMINTPEKATDDYSRKYLTKVRELSKGNMKADVTTFVGDLPGRRAGTCYYYSIIRSIKIDSDNLPYYTEKEKILLYAHEVAHCECGADHTEKLLPDGCPASIMHPVMARTSCTNKHWNRYVKELQEMDC